MKNHSYSLMGLKIGESQGFRTDEVLSVLSACMDVYLLSDKVKEGFQLPRVTDHCESPCGCWTPNSDLPF